MEYIEYVFFHGLIPLDMCVLDKNWTILYANPFFKETVDNHQPEDKNLIQFVDSESSGILQGLLDKAQESLDIVQERARVFDLHESEYNVIVRYYPEQERYYLVFSKEADEQSQALHIRDTLTGLPNRELFMDRVSQLILECKRTKNKIAVLFLDLNGFKPVNDTYGHKAGDAVLQTIADRLQSSLRGLDTVARFGGDEFVVALPDIKKGIHTSLIAKRIMSQIEQPVPIDEHVKVHVSTSIGIALYPDDDSRIQSLLKKADDAMYRAKNSKNGYLFYDMNKVFGS